MPVWDDSVDVTWGVFLVWGGGGAPPPLKPGSVHHWLSMVSHSFNSPMLNGVHMLVRVRVEGVGEEEEGEDRACMGGIPCSLTTCN